MIQGWALDPGHPHFYVITPQQILDGSCTANKGDQTSYIRTHTQKLLTYPWLHKYAPSVISRIIAHPYLSISEDEVFEHVLRYACAHKSLSLLQADDERVVAIMRMLIKHIHTPSLTTRTILRYEELGLVDEHALLPMYREKALQRAGGRARGGRGRCVVVEGSHPVEECAVVTEVCTGAKACVVEFDRRCRVDGGLAIAVDRSCERVVLEWRVWRRPASVKMVRLGVGVFYVLTRGGGGWGWKLYAIPVER